jgi:SNF2 family DNA or RNA helicase
MERYGKLLQPFTTTEEETSHAEETLLTGGLLCDGMGVGKTIETLTLLAENPQKRTLLLMPKALIGTWVENGTRANFPCFVLEGKKWVLKGRGSRSSCLYITNYESVLYKADVTSDLVWDRIVLDESHRIRNPSTRLSRRIINLRADFRWALTGTPLVNQKRDIVAQLAFLGVPHTATFRWIAEYYEPLVPALVIRRSMEDIRGLVAAVPPVARIETHRLFFLSTEEADFYHGLQGLRDAIRYARVTRKQILEMLLRLRQTAVSPEIYMSALRRKDPTYEERWTEPSTKMVALANLVQEEQKEHKFLVFCSFHAEMELLAEYLEDSCGTKAELYHGGLSNGERADVLARAQQPSCRVLLIQLQSGGVGLNLQSFDRCVFMCPWWTAALMDQAIARAVRMGQTKAVRVIHLVLADVEMNGVDIDRFITEKAETKRHMLEEFFELATGLKAKPDTAIITATTATATTAKAAKATATAIAPITITTATTDEDPSPVAS